MATSDLIEINLTVIADHLETFLASLDDDPNTTGLPAYVEREFYAYLQAARLLPVVCGPAHGPD